MRTKGLFGVALGVLIGVWAGCLPAQQRGEDLHQSPRRPAIVPYGVPLAPPIYFVNFIFLYFANPATAAMMPAYRVPLPQPVYDCLQANPDGCPYEQMAKYFRRQASEWVDSRDVDTVYFPDCQTTEPWRSLAPPVYQNASQINEPLGAEKAVQLAHALGIERDMVLTESEYQCVMGAPPRTRAQEILYTCFIDFTASNGNGVVVPFSSYGLNLNEQGNVLSLCAPGAPCLEANKVFLLLPEIAARCGFPAKLEKLLTQTPVLQFIDEGGRCQNRTAPACIAPTVKPKW